MNKHVFTTWARAIVAVATLSVSSFLVSSCSSDGPATTYSVGGTATGISGTGLVLRMNTNEGLAVAMDGGFTFNTVFNIGSTYNITVASYPVGQTCMVTNGTGTVTANVSNVNVECRTNSNPAGYYDDIVTASVGDGAGGSLPLSDFQAMVQDNRFMAVSVSNGLVYAGPLVMFGDDFTATVSVYRNGLLIYSNVAVSGVLVEGASMSGTFAGTEQGAGTFDLVYASTNEEMANVVRIDTNWSSLIGGSTTDAVFAIASSGVVTGAGSPTDGNLSGCSIETVVGGVPVAVIPVTDSGLYRVTVQLTGCDTAAIQTITAGHYTGFATSRTDATLDDTLVFVVTSADGEYSVSGDFK
jgi:hypothetical protein